MWLVTWKQKVSVLDTVSAFTSGVHVMNDSCPLYLYPQHEALMKQWVGSAVSHHTQKNADKWQHHKAMTLFMMDARYGMLAHAEHICLHWEHMLNFSLSILHIPASNLWEIVTFGYDYA